MYEGGQSDEIPKRGAKLIPKINMNQINSRNKNDIELDKQQDFETQ